jgi:glutaredoxin-like YruB-family protein
MSVVVYTTPTCGYCHQLKAYLGQKGVRFTEYDVSRDRQRAMEMVQLSGQQGVPVTSIDGQVVVGFNRPVIDQLLGQMAARPPKLGVAIAEARRIARERGLSLPDGAYVGRVNSGSPAETAGLHPGDVILELAGQAVRSDQDVHRVLGQMHSGESVNMIYWRDGRRIKATARL